MISQSRALFSHRAERRGRDGGCVENRSRDENASDDDRMGDGGNAKNIH